MVDFLIQATLSNLMVATLIGCLALAAQRWVRQASLANFLWALVLIKLVTPPLVGLNLLEIPRVVAQSEVEEIPGGMNELAHEQGIRNDDRLEFLLDDEGSSMNLDVDLPGETESDRASVVFISMVTWFTVSALIMLISAVRIIRFHRMLIAGSAVDKQLTGRFSKRAAERVKLKHPPAILVTDANIAPFVWWMSFRPVIVVSRRAVTELSEEDLELVTIHEMAHIKRRDHWFRWLEWIATLTLWWNPVVWWARAQLRITEEMACDQLVLEKANSEVHQYANALLNMAELLAGSPVQPPVVASAINGGSLERRLKTMISVKQNGSVFVRTALLLFASSVFPLGFVYAQDFEAVERRLGSAVEAGELSLQQANRMMEALRESSPQGELEQNRERVEAESREIMALVEEGELEREEAEMRLMELRHELELREAEVRLVEQDRELLRIRERHERLAEEYDRQKDFLAELLHDEEEHEDGDDEGHAENEFEERQEWKLHLEYAGRAEMLEDAEEMGDPSEEETRDFLNYRRYIQDAENQKQHQYDENLRQLIEARERFNNDLERRHIDLERSYDEAVRAGQLSVEQARRNFAEARREFLDERHEEHGHEHDDRGHDGHDGYFDAHDHDENEEELEASEARLHEFYQQLERAVKSGSLSRDEAAEKMAQLKRRFFRQRDGGEDEEQEYEEREHDSDQNARKEKYLEYVERIKAAVDEGELSKADAEEKLIELRAKLLRRGAGQEEDEEELESMEERKARYFEYAEKIKAAVDEGELSEMDAEKKLIEIRAKLFRRGADQEEDEEELESIEGRKARYLEFVKKIKSAVEEGDLSEADAEEKLIEIRAKLFRR